MKKILALILLLLTLTGCIPGGSEIVLPQRTPAAPPVTEPDPPQVRDCWLVLGQTVLAMRSADGVWSRPAALPDGITGWTIYGDTVTRAETLPADLPAGTLAAAGEGFAPLELQTGSAWEPAADLLYAALRSATGTEPLADPPRVQLLGSGDLTGDGVPVRLLSVRSSYALLVQERDGEYSILPGVTDLLGAYVLDGQPLLLCADGAGSPVLLGYGSGAWTPLLPTE